MTYATLLIVVIGAVSVGTCLFAFVCGRLAERLVAAIIALSIPLGAVISRMPSDMHAVPGLAADGVVAFVVLGLAVRFASRWLGVVLLLYAVQFALHAFYFVTSQPLNPLYARVNDLIFFAVTLSLLVATVGTFRSKRALAAKAPPPDPLDAK